MLEIERETRAGEWACGGPRKCISAKYRGGHGFPRCHGIFCQSCSDRMANKFMGTAVVSVNSILCILIFILALNVERALRAHPHVHFIRSSEMFLSFYEQIIDAQCFLFYISLLNYART